ncbi:MAG: glycosyltransferase [Gammaproteobacteria bacterium]|nr:glycosyltransferase [Gammaproteobacteria bacterium]
MHIWRYHPAVQELARIVATGELGSVHMLRTIRTNWTSPRTDTDSIWTLVPHDLTIALAVLGDIPEPRYALAEVIDGRPVGLIAALGDMPHFVLEASTRYADKRREIRLHCSEGVAIFPGHESGSVLICRGTGLEPETEIRRFDNTPPLRRELEVFVEHLHGGPAPPTGADEGAAVVEMICSPARTGRPPAFGMNSSLRATVVVPTTADRGPLLPYSVGSILNQTVEDLEVFVIGDGVTPATRSVIRDLQQQDARIRFFDHPKDVRRGELYRHAALAEARGRIVCYLCDRDLMLPDHVETMANLLAEADFAHSLRYSISPDGNLSFNIKSDITDPQQRSALSVFEINTQLSMAAHTMSIYRQLPHGWRTTPPGITTDNYMWHQILKQPDCKVAASQWPSDSVFQARQSSGLAC